MRDPMTDETARLRDALGKVLADHAIVPNQNGFHGWRCEHPDRYPDYCHCVPDLLDDLMAVAAEARAGLVSVEALADELQWFYDAGTASTTITKERHDRIGRALAAVRAETLAGSGVVEMQHTPVLFDPTGPVYDSLPHPKASRYELSGALYRDEKSETLDDPDAYDRRILLVTVASAARALAVTPPTPALTAARLADALNRLVEEPLADGVRLEWDDADAAARAILAALATPEEATR